MQSQPSPGSDLKRTGTKLGQNFLVDEAACVRIADALGDVHDRTVVEIGPGHGAITAHLAARCAQLIASSSTPPSPASFSSASATTRTSPCTTPTSSKQIFANSSAERPARPLDVVGNLPYYITSDILLHLFAAAREEILRRAVVMMQREVAERIAADSRFQRIRRALGHHAASRARSAELFTLPPARLLPAARRLLHGDASGLRSPLQRTWGSFEEFNRFLRSTFAQKRKTLANNLRAAGFSASALAAAWPESIPRAGEV